MAHIVRLDKPRLHGWQVRGSGKRGYRSKMFSDQKHGGRDQALSLAQAYREELERDDPPRKSAGSTWRDTPNAANRSGINGVYQTHSVHKSGAVQEYWAAFVPIGPDGQKYTKRFYINSERDEEEAFRLAVEYRRMWEEAAREGEKAIRRFFSEYEEGWL
ncbi:MAG: hypothetical protein HYR94_06465 [Chloroflexi bacterium]|nr:hypothetical protein [Chloroflexota bacterium]